MKLRVFGFVLPKPHMCLLHGRQQFDMFSRLAAVLVEVKVRMFILTSAGGRCS